MSIQFYQRLGYVIRFLQAHVPVDMTEIEICPNIQTISDRNTWEKELDEPMQHPRTFVIGLEADSHIISSHTYADDITSNRVHKVVRSIPCTSNDSETMLKIVS